MLRTNPIWRGGLALATLLLIALTGCGSSRQAPEPPTPDFSLVLPAVGQLPFGPRAASAADQKTADQSFATSGDLVITGTQAQFAPPVGKVSYAIYQFPVDAALQVRSVSYATSARANNATVWIGVSDYSKGYWRSEAGSTDSQQFNLSDPAGALSNGAFCYVAIVAWGDGFTLDSVSLDGAAPFPGWIHSWGNENPDQGGSVEVDASGIFVSAASDEGGLVFHTVLLKYALDGTLLKSRIVIRPDDEFFGARTLYLKLAPSGELYGVGELNEAGNTDVLLFKFDSDLNAVWVRRYDASSLDTSYDMCFDEAGNIVVVGTLAEVDAFDSFILRVSPDGNLVSQVGLIEAVDQGGLYHVSVDPASGVLQACGGVTYGSNQNAWYFARIAADGQLDYSLRLPSHLTSMATGVGYDTTGNTLVCGAEPNVSLNLGDPVNSDAILLRVDPTGTLIEAKAYSYPGSSISANGILMDAFGNLRMRVQWDFAGAVNYLNITGDTLSALSYMHFTDTPYSAELEEFGGSFFFAGTALDRDSATPVPLVDTGIVAADVTADITLETAPGALVTLSGTLVDQTGIVPVDFTGVQDAFEPNGDTLVIRYDPPA